MRATWESSQTFHVPLKRLIPNPTARVSHSLTHSLTPLPLQALQQRSLDNKFSDTAESDKPQTGVSLMIINDSRIFVD